MSVLFQPFLCLNVPVLNLNASNLKHIPIHVIYPFLVPLKAYYVSLSIAFPLLNVPWPFLYLNVPLLILNASNLKHIAVRVLYRFLVPLKPSDVTLFVAFPLFIYMSIKSPQHPRLSSK